MTVVAEHRAHAQSSTQKLSKFKRECLAKSGLELPLASEGEAQKLSRFRGEVRLAAKTSGMP
ncbi:hypothetical protein [Bradyrhizobium sp. McL0616]|uniref:hypothetical protein n=1 Tax=Bradyrhizobium sp. McL0616 TaxID=3415674 RepID=UPI003CFB4B6F